MSGLGERSISVAERMGENLGIPVSHETAAKFDVSDDSDDGGMFGRLTPDDQLSEELQSIFATWTKCIQLRHKYMDQSLQSPGDNPKDSPDWTIYPKPPPPSYIPKKGDNLFHEGPARKPEADIFDLNDCSIPEIGDDYVYKLDSDGVYRVFQYEICKLIIEPPRVKSRFIAFLLPRNTFWTWNLSSTSLVKVFYCH